MVIGLTRENEVVIPLTYKCSSGHTYSTIDRDYLAQLPSLVQKAYPYVTSDNGGAVINSSCTWSVLSPFTLEPVYQHIKNAKQTEFAERVERYLLFVQKIQSRAQNLKLKFPVPPKSYYRSSKGSKWSEWLIPSKRILQEIRIAGTHACKNEIKASFQCVKVSNDMLIMYI